MTTTHNTKCYKSHLAPLLLLFECYYGTEYEKQKFSKSLMVVRQPSFYH